MEGCKGACIQLIADPLHQMIVEPEVVHNSQTHPQKLLCLEQVADIGTGVVAAGRTSTGGVDGALIPLVLGVLDVDDAIPCAQVAGAGVAAGGGGGAIAEGVEVQTLKAPAALDVDENNQIKGIYVTPQMISSIKDGRASIKPTGEEDIYFP